MDADTLLEREALIRIVRPFLEDSKTVAAGGIIRIANGCNVQDGVVTEVGLPKNVFAQFRVLEYLRAFLSGRMGWDAIGCMLIISGAFGIFRRSIVVEVGGFATDTVGEDMELVVRLHRVDLARFIIMEEMGIQLAPPQIVLPDSLERGRVIHLTERIILGPLPTKDEWFEFVVRSGTRRVISLLDPENIDDQPWIEEEESATSASGIRLAIIPVQTEDDIHRVVEAILSSSKKMYVHAFQADWRIELVQKSLEQEMSSRNGIDRETH